jgi:hypothetical protein
MKKTSIVFLVTLILIALSSHNSLSADGRLGKMKKLQGAKSWSEAWIAARTSIAGAKNDQKTNLALIQAVERRVPAAKADVKAFIARLKQLGKWETFDDEVYAHAEADHMTNDEIEAVKKAGGPRAVLEKTDQYLEEDLADLRSRLGISKTHHATAGRRAPYGTGCSLVAWAVKTAFCWTRGCHENMERANNQYCQQ